MKKQLDLAHGWLRKAESDLQAVRTLIEAEASLDAACFHAQQAAEKALKAYLTANSIAFPFTHNLAKLLTISEAKDPDFVELDTIADTLTPYAVESRYDDEFWPKLDESSEALTAAESILEFVRARMPVSKST